MVVMVFIHPFSVEVHLLQLRCRWSHLSLCLGCLWGRIESWTKGLLLSLLLKEFMYFDDVFIHPIDVNF